MNSKMFNRIGVFFLILGMVQISMQEEFWKSESFLKKLKEMRAMQPSGYNYGYNYNVMTETSKTTDPTVTYFLNFFIKINYYKETFFRPQLFQRQQQQLKQRQQQQLQQLLLLQRRQLLPPFQQHQQLILPLLLPRPPHQQQQPKQQIYSIYISYLSYHNYSVFFSHRSRFQFSNCQLVIQYINQSCLTMVIWSWRQLSTEFRSDVKANLLVITEMTHFVIFSMRVYMDISERLMRVQWLEKEPFSMKSHKNVNSSAKIHHFVFWKLSTNNLITF